MTTTETSDNTASVDVSATRIASSVKPSPQFAVWACLGAVSLAVVLNGWIRWILSDDFQATDPGPDKMSAATSAALVVVQFGGTALGAWLVWRFLIRPMRRERRLTLDGMIIIAAFTAWFYDPGANYLNFSFAYNAHAFNRGSWVRFIPGWESPGAIGNFPEPLWVGPSWIWFCFGGAVVCSGILRRIRARHPEMSTLAMFGVLAVCVAIFDIVFESTFLRLEVMQWPGAPRTGTLFAGRPYQFPLIESLFVPSLLFGFTALRYFRDDNGRSFVERGTETLRLPDRARRGVALLAVIGFLHVWVNVAYNLPVQMMAMKADTFPALPSYMRDGICGDGTEFACPGSEVPVPHRGSLHIGPDDPELSPEVRARQGLGNSEGTHDEDQEDKS